MKIIKNIVLVLYVMILVSLSIVYADNNQLSFIGIAYIAEYELGTMLPVFPIVNSQGKYFSSTTLPSALTHGAESWVGDTFTLTIVKPPSVANNGNNHFSMTFQISNPTQLTWTSGTAQVISTGGEWKSAAVALSSTTANPGQIITITFSFSTKIVITSTDNAKIAVSYIVSGVRRYIYMNISMVPV